MVCPSLNANNMVYSAQYACSSFMLMLNVVFLIFFFLKAFKEEEIVGLLVFTGVIYASAYLSPKETVSEAISEVKV